MSLMRGSFSKLITLPLGLALLAITACSGSAVVTITATPSSDPFVAYRVGLASVQLQTSSGKPGLMLLPAETTVDFTKLFDLSEVLGAPAVAKGTYSGAVITLDYSAALIIYDDGSLDGLQLTPVDVNGKALGLISIGVTLDPGDPLRSAAKQVGQLALGFNLAASNAVNLSAKTVTVTPMISASMLPIDAKPVRIRGPILNSNTSFFATGVSPFDSTTAGLGELSIEPSTATAYEINGLVSAGSAGQAQLATLPANTLVSTIGTLTITTGATTPTPIAPASATSTTPATPTPTNTDITFTGTTPATTASSVSFTATQVLVDGGVAGVSADRVSGIVSARSGNTLGIEDATLIQNGGTNTFVPGTTIVNVGPGTLVTFFGQGVPETISAQQISVGSSIDAFGTVSQTSAAGVFLDASASRVRIDLTAAQGLVTAQEDAALTLNLTSLGGRLISALDFTGSGATASQYGVATGSLDLTNSTVAAPVVLTGFPNAFATASPNFTASTLLDPTTIQAELVIDWSGGTAAPFTSFDTSGITLDSSIANIGPRNEIQIGSQVIDLAGLSPGPTITSSTSSSTQVFSIGHSASSTVESFNTYDAFTTQLQTELNGTTLATGMTAVGQYTVSTSAFSATSITLFLNN
jgi:hypothetical protein